MYRCMLPRWFSTHIRSLLMCPAALMRATGPLVREHRLVQRLVALTNGRTGCGDMLDGFYVHWIDEEHHLVHMRVVEIDGRMGIELLFDVVSTRTRFSGGSSPSR